MVFVASVEGKFELLAENKMGERVIASPVPVSNRLLKTCLYQNFDKMVGKLRPTRLVMEDALHKGEQSVLEYSAMKLRDLPDKIFTKDYLKKLE